MSRIVLGVGASHSTLMNTHWEEVAGTDRAEQFRDGLTAARILVAAASPDAVVLVGSNHFRGFWLDLIPAFTVGVGECMASGESGTPSGPVAVDTGLARHVCRSLMHHGFDMAFSARLQVDHGQTHAIQYLLAGLDVPVVPLVVNVFAPPLPELGRCDLLGSGLRHAILSDGSDKRVVVIGSGGLSHQLPFPRWDDPQSDDDLFLVDAWTNGRQRWQDYDSRRREIIRAAPAAVNTGFDREMLQLVVDGQLGRLAQWSSDELEVRGGNGAHELRTWLITAAACGHTPGRTIVYSPMPEWLTGMAISVFEPSPIPPVEEPP